MNEFFDNTDLEEVGSGFLTPNDSGSFTHIGYVRGGYFTVPSSSDIARIHHSRLDEGQIIYALHDSQSYIITKFPAELIDPLTFTFSPVSASYSEFYFPTSSGGGVGVGFPYSGSDDQFGTPAQAIITGSLLLSGSGNITASNLTLVGSISSSGNISASGNIMGNNLSLSSNLIVNGDSEFYGDVLLSNSSLEVDDNLNVGGNADIDGNLDIGGTLSFDGFTFSDGNISVLSGSNIFGTSSLNTHQFTGSVLITGSTNLIGDLTVNGNIEGPGNINLGGNAVFGGEQVTVAGDLNVVGDLLINGNPLDFSGIEDQEIFVAHVMINTGDLGDGGLILEDANDFDSTVPVQRGNANNQIAISSSETPAVQLVPGDKVRIDWIYNNVSHSHTTYIFDVREDDSTTGLGAPGTLLANNPSPFKWLSSYLDLNPNANPPYKAKYIGFDFNTNSSMSLHTGITASHWINLVSQSTINYVNANGPIENNVIIGFDSAIPPNPIYSNVFDTPGIINTTWNTTPPTDHGEHQEGRNPLIHKTFKLYKIIPGVPCCTVFSDDITIHGGVTTIDGPIRADGELISEQGLIVKVPDNPNFHDPTKYIKDRNLEIPMVSVKSGSVTPIEINDQGILKLHSFDTPTDDTPDFEPVPFKGGFMFRDNELYIGKE